jgi:hypothetical protein
VTQLKNLEKIKRLLLSTQQAGHPTWVPMQLAKLKVWEGNLAQ